VKDDLCSDSNHQAWQGEGFSKILCSLDVLLLLHQGKSRETVLLALSR
jgi:hypothetical protein